MAQPTRPATEKDSTRLSAQHPGEKAVEKTDSDVPVAPEPQPAVPDHPTDPAAIDQRKQFTGTDEPAQPPD